MAKPPATAVSKYGNLASVPALGRRLFLCRFTPFHLRFRDLLPVFQDDKARGGIMRNGSKDLSRMSRRAIFVPENETRPFRARETQIELNGRFYGLRTAFPQVVNGE